MTSPLAMASDGGQIVRRNMQAVAQESAALALTVGRRARARVEVRTGLTRSEINRARSDGPLRLLFPRSSTSSDAAWIVTSSLGGGLVGGDDIELDVAVRERASAVITTQSSTKVYRGASRQTLRATAAAEATLLIVPDPVVPYRDASFTQKTSVELATSASAVIVDGFTAGRLAYGERWDFARLDSTLSVRVGERLLLLDRIVLGRDAQAVAERMRRFAALCTVFVHGPRFAALALEALDRANAAPLVRDMNSLVVGSPIGDGALFRVAATEPVLAIAQVRELLRGVLSLVGDDPWSGKW